MYVIMGKEEVDVRCSMFDAVRAERTLTSIMRRLNVMIGHVSTSSSLRA